VSHARVKLSRPAATVLAAMERFVLHEGAFRSSKTWACLIKWRRWIEDYPGIALVMARWKEDDLNAILVPDYRKVCALMGLPVGEWDASERCFKFGNDSVLYATHLKSSEIEAMHSKARGKTVAGVYISQLEEVPEAVTREWMLRLSQPGFPQQFLADANPVHSGHYLTKIWPADNAKPNYRYVSASIWDNKHNLDPATIEAAEEMYPVGHPMRAAKLEGKRGPNLEGMPVYGGCFDPLKHVANGLEPYPLVDVIAGWDFGAKHPAVVFAQFLPWGALWILGGIMGADVVLDGKDGFAEKVKQLSSEWFPKHQIVHCGDPAGSHRNSQGVSINAVKALASCGVSLKVLPDSNHNTVRKACVETLQGYMLGSVRRFVLDADRPVDYLDAKSTVIAPTYAPAFEPAFLLNPRFQMWNPRSAGSVPVLLEAFGAGYIWDDDHRRFSQTDGNLRMPKKDGFFEHPMNASEYIIHNFYQPKPTDKALARNFRQTTKEHYRVTHGLPSKEEQRALRAAQRDKDPDEISSWRHGMKRRTGSGFRRPRRGGY
jgi:hypothetical protein